MIFFRYILITFVFLIFTASCCNRQDELPSDNKKTDIVYSIELTEQESLSDTLKTGEVAEVHINFNNSDTLLSRIISAFHTSRSKRNQ